MISRETLQDRAREIGDQVAAQFADDVDREARFPAETIAALRGSGLLAALVPSDRGGEGASIAAVAESVSLLAEHCASSALVLAMHSIQVACLLRHATDVTLDLVVPGLLSGDLLLANANSEVGLGGERRSSICALEQITDGYRLEKRASTVSYGEYADGVLATARRTPEAPANEQVFVICLPPSLSLEPLGGWDTLGMRGTCSRPALVCAELCAEQVLDDYADIFARTSLGASAVLLSSVWLGISEAAGKRAHAVVRAQARKRRTVGPGVPPPTAALRLAELSVILHQLREVVAGGAAYFGSVMDSDEVTRLRFSSRMDNLKVASSSLVVEIVQRAMQICGLAGYQNGLPESLGRLSRDAAAAPLMINNDRTLAAMAQTLMIRKEL